jgi:PhnB protein
MPDQTAIDPTERPEPAVMRGVIPYLGLRGKAGEAAAFYARAFGATELGRVPDPEQPGRFLHLQVEINGGALMMTDHGADGDAPFPGLSGAHLQLVVADGKSWWSRAIAAGCREVMPYERQFWGDDWGMVEDPFGIRWAILEPGTEPAG